jgi:hypothetical protein
MLCRLHDSRKLIFKTPSLYPVGEKLEFDNPVDLPTHSKLLIACDKLSAQLLGSLPNSELLNNNDCLYFLSRYCLIKSLNSLTSPLPL